MAQYREKGRGPWSTMTNWHVLGLLVYSQLSHGFSVVHQLALELVRAVCRQAFGMKCFTKIWGWISSCHSTQAWRFSSAGRVRAGGTFSYPLRDWDIVPGEWPDYRPSTRITFLLLIIGCTAKNHLHPPSLDFQIENVEWVSADESESEQPPWNALHSWPPQTHSRSWFGAEGSVQKELLAQGLKISDVCVLPRTFCRA